MGSRGLRNYNGDLSKDVKQLARENSAHKKEFDELQGNFRQKQQELTCDVPVKHYGSLFSKFVEV